MHSLIMLPQDVVLRNKKKSPIGPDCITSEI